MGQRKPELYVKNIGRNFSSDLLKLIPMVKSTSTLDI